MLFLKNMNKKVAVFFTVYNEEKIIGDLIRRVPNEYDPFVIDDGSYDKSAEIAEKNGAKILKHIINIGQGNAVITMFKYLINSDYEYAVVMDGDGQHNPEESVNFVRELEKNRDIDVIQGSRILGKDYKNPPFFRKIFLKPLTKVLNLLTGYSLTDSMCGYRAYRIKTLKKIGFIFDTFKEPEYMVSELWIKFSLLGLKIKEIPVTMNERRIGVSYKGLLRYGWGVFSTILRTKLELLRYDYKKTRKK